MKTVVIPDIHNKIDIVDAILKREINYDSCVFLGDYFDSRQDNVLMAEKTAIWLKNSLQNPRHTHLWGNHDIAYGFKAEFCKCSGYTDEKNRVIRNILKQEDFDKLRFFQFVDGWLCSHAGLHPYFLPPLWKKDHINESMITSWLKYESKNFKLNVLTETTHWFAVCGDSRRYYPIGLEQGGLLWCDSQEFKPIDKLPQIFGHTVQKDPNDHKKLGFPLVQRGETGLEMIKSVEVLQRKFRQNEYWNIALDVALTYYAVIENGEAQIHHYENPIQK